MPFSQAHLIFFLQNPGGGGAAPMPPTPGYASAIMTLLLNTVFPSD